MSEEIRKCVENLDNFKGLSLSSKETLESESIETAHTQEDISAELVSSSMGIPHESGSAESSAGKSDLFSAKCESSEFDSTKSECVNKTGNRYEVQPSPDLTGKDRKFAAIESIQEELKDNSVLSEKSHIYSGHFLNNFSRNSEHSTTSLKGIREHFSSDTLSTKFDGDSEKSSGLKRFLTNQFTLISGYRTPLISSKCVTPQSTAESGVFTEPRSSFSSLSSGKRYTCFDSLETLLTDRSLSTLPWSKINNSFFYSFTTRRIREHYNTLFDFDDFKHACSLHSNAYRRTLNIKYISLPLSRFLMEDFIDFVDFLNGTEIELRESRSNTFPSNSKDKKLAFVRENFSRGVLQMESQTICNLLEELVLYNLEQTKASSTNRDETASTESQSDSNKTQHDKTVFCPKIVSECSDSSKESRKPCQFFSLEMHRVMRIEPEIENLEDPFVAERLETLNEEISRLMIRCISDTRMILDICINTKYIELEKHLRNYFPGIEVLLNRLVVLREDVGILLGTWNGQNNNEMILSILKVKIQIGSALQKLLLNFSKINSEFLEKSSILFDTFV